MVYYDAQRFDSGTHTKDMKYRLANFCDLDCKVQYENFVRMNTDLTADQGAANESQVVSRSLLDTWETMRRQHHRCFYCSQKLPKSRTRSIG